MKLTEGNIRHILVQIQWGLGLVNFINIFDLVVRSGGIRWWHYMFPFLMMLYLIYYFLRMRPKELANTARANPEWMELKKLVKETRDKLDELLDNKK